MDSKSSLRISSFARVTAGARARSLPGWLMRLPNGGAGVTRGVGPSGFWESHATAVRATKTSPPPQNRDQNDFDSSYLPFRLWEAVIPGCEYVAFPVKLLLRARQSGCRALRRKTGLSAATGRGRVAPVETRRSGGRRRAWCRWPHPLGQGGGHRCLRSGRHDAKRGCQHPSRLHTGPPAPARCRRCPGTWSLGPSTGRNALPPRRAFVRRPEPQWDPQDPVEDDEGRPRHQEADGTADHGRGQRPHLPEK